MSSDRDHAPSDLEQTGPDAAGTPIIYSQVAYLALAQRLEEAEQALSVQQASLVEKDALIKDIQHRVKNSFQVIISLINLQTDNIKDPVALSAIKEIRDRVMSTAFVYELLYRSDELARLPFDNLVQRMLDHLFYSYSVDPERVHLLLQVESVTLSIEDAIPCGLILNELVSNSLKHAFPNSRAGSIWVELKQQDQQIMLIVRDDGVGFPPDFEIAAATSLGLQLVNILTHQLLGKLNLRFESKTEFLITFPVK